MRKSFVALAVLLTWTTLLAQQINTNESIFKMIKMGFSEEVILNSIDHSPGAYDTSVDALIALKKAGVSNSVMAAIVRKSDAQPQIKPATAPPSQVVPTTAPVSTAPRSSSIPSVAPPKTDLPPVKSVAVRAPSMTRNGAQTAKQIYAMAQSSVFLIYLNDSSGTPSALGSAFLIAPRTLVTNAHVVDAGEPFLAVGPVRIPLNLVSKDEKNDLAVLTTGTDLSSLPLAMAIDQVTPGEEIFAIGNPEGLEKTISGGIVSGVRNEDGRQVLQITSPISHGSSGGPILNSKGEVVGVAVGMIEGGQNLNFAVPIKYVQALIDRKVSVDESTINVPKSVAEANDLILKRSQEEYSSDASSSYQLHTQKLLSLINELASVPQWEVLTRVACWGTTGFDLSDAGIKAAKALLKLSPSSDNRALLAYTLYDRSENEELVSFFAAEGSPEKERAQKAHDHFLTEAESTAQSATRETATSPLVLNYVLAGVKDERQQFGEAITLHTALTTSNVTFCGTDLTQKSFQALITESYRDHPDAAEKWFKRYAALYQPEPYEWNSEGDRRHDANEPELAADAYERAATSSKNYSYDFCYASAARQIQEQVNQDAVLSDGRRCIAASVEQTDKESQKEFEHILPVVYRGMADVLETRGVFEQGLQYAKESLALRPDDSLALDTEAKLFEDLERYSECISAEQAAVRASDGKYSTMHFRLGSCYFDSENWSQAATSFRIAAQADKSDAASAYNLGLSLSRQGYTTDAAQWFREALSRKPDSETRTKILSAMK